MTLDEAIAGCKNYCGFDFEELDQLSEWLEELKELRNMTAGHLYAVAFNRGYLKAEKEVREKTIDDLIAKCENAKFSESDEISLSDVHTGVNSGLSMAIHFAEQLKVGGENV